MREMDGTLFSSVAGGVGGELVKLSGGVICSDCCALTIPQVLDPRPRLQVDVGHITLEGKRHSAVCY